MALPGFLQTPIPLDLRCGRNGILRIGVQYTLNDAGVDITGCGFKMQTRASPGAVNPAYTDIDTGGATSKITITDAANGWIELYISNAHLASIPAASVVANDAVVSYDIVLYEPGYTSYASPATDFYRIIAGSLTVNEGVTRP